MIVKEKHKLTYWLVQSNTGILSLVELVGADQYWNLVTGGIIWEESGLTTIHTKLGWVLSGKVHGPHHLMFATDQQLQLLV